MHGAPNYTPYQIMEAGQRAEADGQLQYAVQFYKHLLDNFTSSPEAGFAHERLLHLEPPPHNLHAHGQPAFSAPLTAGSSLQTQAPLQSHGRHAAPTYAVSGQAAPGQVLPGQYAPYDQQYVTHDQQLPMPAIARPRGETAPREATARMQAMAAPRDAYRLGRFVARVVTVTGWAGFIIGGLAAMVAGFAQAGIVPAKSLGFLAIVLPFGGVAAASGFAMIFFGQFARASFDTANATRELVAIARNKSGPAAGQQRH